MKVKLFEKLEQFLVNLHLDELKEPTNASADDNEPPKEGTVLDSASSAAHEVKNRSSI